MHRSERFSEKLATPDVTVADLIGDVDPIKAANLKLSYADDRVIHFGMIPRAYRCIFVINELPDLQARIQAMGAEANLLVGDEYGKMIQSETSRWSEVIKAAGIVVE